MRARPHRVHHLEENPLPGPKLDYALLSAPLKEGTRHRLHGSAGNVPAVGRFCRRSAEGVPVHRPSARTARSRTSSGLSGAAALIGVAALVVSAVPAHAAPAGPPGPGQVTAGQRTATPALVSGLREPVTASGSAADAARAHLADHGSRYHIGSPRRDLEPARTSVTGRSETVRFLQKHHGVDVLGGQYVVRMERKDGKRVVTGTSGKYFTGLKVATAPGIDAKEAVERAVEEVEEQLGPWRPAPGSTADEPDQREPLTGTARGLVVLPRGAGVLTHHVTVSGSDPATGAPVLREVYVEANSGQPLLQYSGIKSFLREDKREGQPEGAADAPAVGASMGQARQALAQGSGTQDGGIKGSGVRLDGTTVELQVERDDARQAYVLRDRSRAAAGSRKNRISTWDARGLYRHQVDKVWPEGLKEFGSPNPAFGKEATDAGAVDAHWAAGKVLDYYKSVHGRDALDGHGKVVDSLVGVKTDGVFWDGSKAVYGAGDETYLPASAALDAVGHTLTYGVIDSSANLMYAGQSGALDEAIADYFGGAIRTDAYGIPMDSPDSGLVGEALCRAKTPHACAVRDMNDGRTTAKSFVGVAIGTDNGGVHLNSTIFSGALWDIRKDLDRTLADRIVYKALTEYLTPLDGFTEGRAAVVAAAKDLKVSDSQLRAVERAFNGHGIVPGWETATGVDSDLLLGGVNTGGRDETSPGTGGGWWVASKSSEDGSEPYSVWAGRLDGTGEKKLISPNDGKYHIDPVTDGKTVVWKVDRGYSSQIYMRSLAGGPVKKVYNTGFFLGHAYAMHVEGKLLAFWVTQHRGGPRVVYLSLDNPEGAVVVYPEPWGKYAATEATSLKNGRISFSDLHRSPRGWRWDVEVIDTATGKRTRMQQPDKPVDVRSTAITDKYVYWLAETLDDAENPTGRTAVRRANLDGTGTVDISPGTGKDALRATGLSASEDAVTVAAATPDTQARNETLGKVWQLSPDGARRDRVSCNRGEQLMPVAADGRQVVWIDATTGSTDLVTRTRPAGNCG
ncbi:peptidase M4 family protein [Streptomyces griseocarneus]|nr:peptidase M4 family protein [Streptomyces griseocarneus]